MQISVQIRANESDRAGEVAAKIAVALLMGYLTFGLGYVLALHDANERNCRVISSGVYKNGICVGKADGLPIPFKVGL